MQLILAPQPEQRRCLRSEHYTSRLFCDIERNAAQIGAEISARNADLKNPIRGEYEAEESAFNDEITEVMAGCVDFFLNPEAEQGSSNGYHVALSFLLRHLPDRLRASALCEIYDEHFHWSTPQAFLINRCD